MFPRLGWHRATDGLRLIPPVARCCALRARASTGGIAPAEGAATVQAPAKDALQGVVAFVLVTRVGSGRREGGRHGCADRNKRKRDRPDEPLLHRSAPFG
ncbi:MAG: hypothetical protein F4X05_11655 [Rhodothermaceae bacterium]|nr:hypothetical protein [Rhodothermaceae bacterium]